MPGHSGAALRIIAPRLGQDGRVTTTTSTPDLGPGPDAETADRPATGALARRWRIAALLGLCALTAALYTWNLSAAGFPPFYSMAVRSMSMSWKAMFYGAADPLSTLTMDKLAGSFVPQALSARIFGFHAWSLALPQVLEGVAAVLVFHRTVRRWTGSRDAALLGALLLAFTPVVASMFEHSMEDGALTLCLVLAADRYQYAVAHGRLRSLVFAGIWVGVGFQAKMLEAWVILPALALGYLATAPLPRAKRAAHTAVAGVVMFATSLSWVLLYTFTPAADRPYIDGTSNNNAFSMVFGYNGVSRLGIRVPGALGTSSGANLHRALHQLGISSGSGQTQSFGADGWGKLFGPAFAPEIGWLYPLALLALGAGLWWTRRAARTDVLRGGFLFWGLWFVTGGLVLSAMAIPHMAYLALLAPPICALSAAGIALYWRTWLLPVAVLAEALWTAHLAQQYAKFLPWLTPVVIVLAVLSLVLVVAAGLRRSTAPMGGPMRLAAILGASAMLATPLAWAVATMNPTYSGNALDAIAGPVQFGFTAAGSTTPTSRQAGQAPQTSGSSLDQDVRMNAGQRSLLAYVQGHAHTAYAFATDDWLTAQPYIDGAGAAVLPMGGFSTTAPAPSLAAVQADVQSKRLAYFLLDVPGTFNMGFLFGTVGGGPTIKSVDAWVRTSCRTVPSTAYGVPKGSTSQVLYNCASVT